MGSISVVAYFYTFITPQTHKSQLSPCPQGTTWSLELRVSSVRNYPVNRGRHPQSGRYIFVMQAWEDYCGLISIYLSSGHMCPVRDNAWPDLTVTSVVSRRTDLCLDLCLEKSLFGTQFSIRVYRHNDPVCLQIQLDFAVILCCTFVDQLRDLLVSAQILSEHDMGHRLVDSLRSGTNIRLYVSA